LKIYKEIRIPTPT